jgi:hypothetical protein
MARRLAVLIALLLISAAPPRGEAQQARPDVSPADRQAIRTIIQSQVDAFLRDDGEAAFGYASPAIREMFGNASNFMDMVRRGYPMVYRPKAFDFDEIVTMNGEPTQKVHVVGPDGRPVDAFYPMTRLPDGSWRIDGCYLREPEEHQA